MCVRARVKRVFSLSLKACFFAFLRERALLITFLPLAGFFIVTESLFVSHTFCKREGGGGERELTFIVLSNIFARYIH